MASAELSASLPSKNVTSNWNPATAYKKFLLHNGARVASIESTLRTLTWFLPGQFQDADFASEALYSSLNLLSIYHDSLILPLLPLLPAASRPPTSPHARYTKFWTQSNRSYKVLSRCLTVLGYTELLIEMGVRKKWGRKNQKRVVLSVEVVKALIRLVLMHATASRPVIHPPMPEREVDPSVLDQYNTPLPPSDSLAAPRQQPGGNELSQFWTGTRTGNLHPTIASIRARSRSPTSGRQATSKRKDVETEVEEYLSSRVLTPDDVRRPQDLVRRLDGMGQVAEIIWILRPVFYVLFLQKYGNKHALPFLLSLSLEYTAHSMRQTYLQRQSASSGVSVSQLTSEVEKQEDTKRTRAFWRYFLRGPIWKSWTRPQIETLIRMFSGTPILGLASNYLELYLPLLEEYYYYSA